MTNDTASQNLLGARISKMRSEAGLTQDQLAGACNRLGWDISRATLSKIEYGIRRLNDAEVLLLATALKTSVAELYEGLTAAKALPVARHSKS
ncbi:hypothetical protein Rhal01_03537 [Rubritalea halochordaticola]|uniref:HTH cro/C1-type domain-containing protein n=1 Tax=Rubritalea halochordaticola TaxID=714537 RepID=A0ABP9V727_9BACT